MKTGVIVSIAVGALACASLAQAQEKPAQPSLGRVVSAPQRALELGAGASFNQGIGRLSSRAGDTVRSVAGPGIMAEVDLGYRVSPHFMMGAYGTASQFNANDRLPTNSNVRAATAGLQAQWHFNPYKAMDPWIGLGAGYHGLFVVPERGGVTARHGIDLARVQVGADYRVAPEFAIGPTIGGGASMFLAERFPGETTAMVPGRRVNFYVSAGVTGRFDILGNAVRPSTATTSASR